MLLGLSFTIIWRYTLPVVKTNNVIHSPTFVCMHISISLWNINSKSKEIKIKKIHIIDHVNFTSCDVIGIF